MTDPHKHEDTKVTASHLKVRSSHWPSVRKAFIQQHPQCVVCGSTHGLNVHHQVPFSYCIPLGRPELEFEAANLVTLCTAGHDHHLLLGHLDFFGSYNPTLLDDVKHYKNKTATEITNDRKWRHKRDNRPEPYSKMTSENRMRLRDYLDTRFPTDIGANTRAQKVKRATPQETTLYPTL